MLNFPGVLVSRASADIISHEGALQEIELGTAEVETDKNLLWNPATREYKKIPEQPIGNNGMSAIICFGL